MDDILARYFDYRPASSQLGKLIDAYYADRERKNDPCWKQIVSPHYGICDCCDVFVGTGKQGNILALYSAAETMLVEEDEPDARYPCHFVKDSAYGFYGIKMNILAHLSPVRVDTLLLFYRGNLSRSFRKKEILATLVLDHYRIHFMQEDLEKENTEKENREKSIPTKSKLLL